MVVCTSISKLAVAPAGIPVALRQLASAPKLLQAQPASAVVATVTAGTSGVSKIVTGTVTAPGPALLTVT